MTNINAETILANLAPSATEILRSHFRAEVAAEISTGIITEKPQPKRTKTITAVTDKKRGPQNRQHTADGVSSSQFIRNCCPDMSAKEVVEAGAKAGLVFSTSLVCNVRAAAMKKAEKELTEKEIEQKNTERKEKLKQNLEKARAKRIANKAARDAEAAKNAEVTE